MAQDKYYRLGIDIGGTFTDFTLYDKRDNSTDRTDTNPSEEKIKEILTKL